MGPFSSDQVFTDYYWACWLANDQAQGRLACRYVATVDQAFADLTGLVGLRCWVFLFVVATVSENCAVTCAILIRDSTGFAIPPNSVVVVPHL